MSRAPRVPRDLALVPFVGSRAIAAGLVTKDMLRRPVWRRLLPDVYVHRDAYREEDHRMWCDAVALTLPTGAAINGRSAAYLWGVDLLDRTSPVSVVLPATLRRRPHPRVAVSNHSLSDRRPHPVRRAAGDTPVRTAFDLGRQAPLIEALVAVDALLNRRLVKVATLAGYLDVHRGWPGTAQLREVLTLAEPLSESPMETRLRLVLYDAGLPRPTAQHDVHDARGRFLGRLDLAYPRWRVAIEYEGDHHRERAQFRRDVARLNVLRAAGWVVLRFTADDVIRHPGRIVHLVTGAIRERH